METIPAEIVVTLLRYAFRGWGNVHIEANQKGVFAQWHAISLYDKIAADMLAIGRATAVWSYSRRMPRRGPSRLILWKSINNRKWDG